MSDNSYMSVLRVWAAIAWADGVIAPAEAEAMRRLIAAAPIDEAERKVATTWLTERVELDTAQVSDLSDEARQGIYQAAVRLARVDLDLASEEKDMLVKLREKLRIDADVAAEIEAKIG